MVYFFLFVTLKNHFRPCFFIQKVLKDILQKFRLVNWWIRGFVFWCHENISQHSSATTGIEQARRGVTFYSGRGIVCSRKEYFGQKRDGSFISRGQNFSQRNGAYRRRSFNIWWTLTCSRWIRQGPLKKWTEHSQELHLFKIQSRGAGWGSIFWTMSIYNPKNFISISF